MGQICATNVQLMRSTTVEIEDIAELEQLLTDRRDLSGVVLNGLELDQVSDRFLACKLRGAVLIGCSASPELLAFATWSGAAVFPPLGELPYRPYRKALYGALDLYDNFESDQPESYSDTLDAKVYSHWQQTGGGECTDLLENLGRRIHDHSITEAIEGLIEGHEVVAVMGGHGLCRDDDGYSAVSRMSRHLARQGKLMASGGGPGAMEATHLGSWMAPYSDEDLQVALAILAAAPSFEPVFEWLVAAFRRQITVSGVRRIANLAWHPDMALRPRTSKRLRHAHCQVLRQRGQRRRAADHRRHGVIFTPGSAGTVQEIFQDATQNHYETAGPPSPMVFFGSHFWREELPVTAVIDSLGRDRAWTDHVTVTDDEDEAVDAIMSHRRR